MKDVPFQLTPEIQYEKFVEQFFLCSGRKASTIVIGLNGLYNHRKIVVSTNLTNWDRMLSNVMKACDAKGVSSGHQLMILDVIDNNSDLILLNGKPKNNDEDSEIDGVRIDSVERNGEISRKWIVEEIEKAKVKNKDISFEEWSHGLLERYNTMKETAERNFPHSWSGIEFTLSVLKILNIGECTLPFAGIMLARSGGNKTLSSSMLVPWPFVYYTRKFSARAFVSHNTAITVEDLPNIDMLPKIRFKMLLTPELAPIFSASEDELLENIGIITSILDGKGYTSDSGAHGQRGYYGNYFFVWVGAAVDIPFRVHKLLSTLGPKLYCFRLPYLEPSDAEIEDGMNEKFETKKREVQEAVIEYLIWFETCPYLTDDPETGLPKMTWNSDSDDPEAKRHLAKLAKLLGKQRCHVEIWSQKQPGEHEYSGYGYAIPNPEDPRRAAASLYNLARGRALTKGRNHITMEDVHLATKVALSTGSQERIAVLDVLAAKKGKATVSLISDALSMSKSTALKTMTELEAVGIVKMEMVLISSNETKQVSIRENFTWLYEDEFLRLKGDYNPVDRSRYDIIRYQKDPKAEAILIKFGELEQGSENGRVEEKKLKEKLLNETSGIFVGEIDIEISIKKMIQAGEICHGIQEYIRGSTKAKPEENERLVGQGV